MVRIRREIGLSRHSPENGTCEKATLLVFYGAVAILIGIMFMAPWKGEKALMVVGVRRVGGGGGGLAPGTAWISVSLDLVIPYIQAGGRQKL